jgi:DNA-binding HxlR family transcriptional regulator
MADPGDPIAEVWCPVNATMELLQQKWTLLILRTLREGKMRFNELAAAVGGCNSRTLRDRLKTLEDEAIVSRRMVAVMPPWVEYELTDKGRALGLALEGLVQWSLEWMARDKLGECAEGLKNGEGDMERSRAGGK